MLAEVLSTIQIGHFTLFVAGIAVLFWSGPTVVASCGTRQACRALGSRRVWAYQRGYSALAIGTRLLMIVAALFVFVRVVF